jgi:oligogalacturonide lyase
MSKGKTFPTEKRLLSNQHTGARVRQVTEFPSVHHHPFYYVPAWDDAMQWLFFVSHRTGKPQLFAEEVATGRLVQLTDREDLNEWSIHPSHDGRFAYFTAGSGAWRVSTETLREECLADFGNVPIIVPGTVGDAMGTTSLSYDDHFWAVPVRVQGMAQLQIIDTSSGNRQVIVEAASVGHPQFHPRDANLLRYAGSFGERMWVVNRDGSENRLAYVRDAESKQWIVHEVWHPLRRELLTVDWPRGMIGVDVDTGQIRRVCAFNAWHAMISRDGRQMVCDTTFPDQGLFLFDPNDGLGQPHFLCVSESSNKGDHWGVGHCPYDDGPVKVHAPQHTHPHPHFSPDGRRVVFTSDRTGHAQLYEVELGN